MKSVLSAFLLTSSALTAIATTAVDSTLQTRVGYDTNLLGTSGTSSVSVGDEESLVLSAGVGTALTISSPSDVRSRLVFSYTGEAVRFDDWTADNFSSHRFGVGGKLTTKSWTFSTENASTLIAGSRHTVTSVSTVNGNSTTLWRERRRQWQHRLKSQIETTVRDNIVVRATGTLLDYDYQTNVVPGKVAFADRSDVQGAVEIGWKQNAKSLWLGGVRVGHQSQAIVPLPNCEFEYSNNYTRLSAAWEGQLPGHTLLTFAAGPDFRTYDGQVDPRIYPQDHHVTSLWFDGGFTSKFTSALSLTGKASRMNWLSSTGKSAYTDTCADAILTWIINPKWTSRISAKVHECDYFPAVRDDWESLIGVGATLQLTKKAALTLDVLSHRAWNSIDGISERKFERVLVNAGASLKF